MSWWVEQGYHNFEEGKGEFPRVGQVIKYYRERTKDEQGKVYTQKALADILGVKVGAIKDIENKDAEVSTERRQVLCKLFNIPPKLLGVTTVAEIAAMEEKKQPPFLMTHPGSSPVDIEEHHTYLKSVRTMHAQAISSPMPAHLARIDRLEAELPYVSDNKPIQRLLCEYHRMVASMLRDKTLYNDSLAHINQAIVLARSLNDQELIAFCLLTCGNMWKDAGYADRAVEIFDRINQRGLPDYLIGPLLLYSGPAYAKAAQSEREQTAALARFERGANIARATRSKENPYGLDLSIPRYHLNRAAALIDLGRNKDAEEELRFVDSNRVWHTSYAHILEAQTYVNRKMYKRAIPYALAGLEVVKQINSRVNIARVAGIYQQLRESPYRDNEETAKLGSLLGG